MNDILHEIDIHVQNGSHHLWREEQILTCEDLTKSIESHKFYDFFGVKSDFFKLNNLRDSIEIFPL